MRILAVTPYYSPEGGGLERYAHAILSRLAASGHDVETICFTRSHLPAMRREGVRVTRVAPRFKVGNTPLDPGFRNAVRNKIREMAPDVVVAHTPVPFPAEMAYLASRPHDVPFVTTYHAGRLRGSSVARDCLARLDRWTLERQMLRGSTRLIAVGPYVRDHALARQRDRVRIVAPGVDGDRFSPVEDARTPTILFVGPLSRSYRWKGIDILLEAFSKVRREIPEAQLTIVGDGDRFRELDHKARQSEGAIHLEGHVAEERLVALYQEAAVGVLPSTTDAESFGMVLAEANACGRPVVASDVGGIPDFVEDGKNGLLAAAGDATDLALKLIRVLEDRRLARAMGNYGRAKVLAHHDWDDLAGSTEQVLAEAVAA